MPENVKVCQQFFSDKLRSDTCVRLFNDSSALEMIISHIAHNIVGKRQQYFEYFIAIEIMSKNFCQIL